VLRIGVLVCGFVIAAGLMSRLLHIGGGANQSSHQLINQLMSGTEMPNYHAVSNPVELAKGMFGWQADLVMTAGLLLLIGLPITRVALTVIIFLHERDWPFVAITLCVLTVLLSGIFLGRAL